MLRFRRRGSWHLISVFHKPTFQADPLPYPMLYCACYSHTILILSYQHTIRYHTHHTHHTHTYQIQYTYHTHQRLSQTHIPSWPLAISCFTILVARIPYSYHHTIIPYCITLIIFIILIILIRVFHKPPFQADPLPYHTLPCSLLEHHIAS